MIEHLLGFFWPLVKQYQADYLQCFAKTHLFRQNAPTNVLELMERRRISHNPAE
jgi:hypothetical protein